MNTFRIEMAEHADYFVFLMNQSFSHWWEWKETKRSADYIGRIGGLDCALVSMDKGESQAKKEIVKVLDKWQFQNVRIRPVITQELNKQFDAVERMAYDMGQWS